MGKNRAMKELESATEAVARRPGWLITALALGVIGAVVWMVMSRQS